MKHPLAYITAPWGDSCRENEETAARYCRQVYDAGYSPICPMLVLSKFLKDSISQEHKDGLDMAKDYLRRSHVLVVCGNDVTEAMKNDIAVAEHLHITATKAAMRSKQEKGGYISCCTYGYKTSPENKHKMIIDEPAAEIVREIFDAVIAGKSTSEIAANLNARGIPTPQEYKGVHRKEKTAPQWTHSRIVYTIRNIKYTGVMTNHMDDLERIDAYTGRIERYVETMSKVQRLEQVQPKKALFDTAALSADLEKALGFSITEYGKQLHFHGLPVCGTVSLDKAMLFQIAENLTTNALRFAKENVAVKLTIEGENLILEVTDDGDGFPTDLLKNGIQPFRKGTEEAEHLGMGLYICDLLCHKHGGALKIANTNTGAVASAILKIS